MPFAFAAEGSFTISLSFALREGMLHFGVTVAFTGGYSAFAAGSAMAIAFFGIFRVGTLPFGETFAFTAGGSPSV